MKMCFLSSDKNHSRKKTDSVQNGCNIGICSVFPCGKYSASQLVWKSFSALFLLLHSP